MANKQEMLENCLEQLEFAIEEYENLKERLKSAKQKINILASAYAKMKEDIQLEYEVRMHASHKCDRSPINHCVVKKTVNCYGTLNYKCIFCGCEYNYGDGDL